MTNKPTISTAEITKALDFRYACKKFDADKKITDEDMALILEQFASHQPRTVLSNSTSSSPKINSCARI